MTKNLNINPLTLIAIKQRVGQEDADAIALPVLAWLDAAKRGQCTAAGCNHLTTHIIIALRVAAITKSKHYYDTVMKGYEALNKAAQRPTDLLDLTTAEYKALRAAFSWYIRSLPQVEVGALNDACKVAQKMMGA